MRKSCRAGSSGFADANAFGQAPASRSVANRTAHYAAGPYVRYSDVCFRAKPGFAIVAGSLPVNPIQTASAATPLPPRRKPVQAIPTETPSQPAPQCELPRTSPSNADVVRPGQHRPESVISPVNRSRPHRPSAPIPRQRAKHRPMPLQSSVFAGIFTVITAFTFAAVWWLERPNSSLLAKATSSLPAGPLASIGDSRKAPVPVPGFAAKPRDSEAVPAKSTEVGGNKNGAAPGKVAASSDGPPMTQPSSSGSSGVGSSTVASADKPQRDSATNASAGVGQKQMKKEERRRTARASVPAVTTRRSEEITRLKAQAFSETRKDRVDKSRPSAKPSVPSQSVNERAIKQIADNGVRSVKQADLADEFNQCKRKSRFLDREKCKWRVCGGKWGKRGCPAYDQKIPSY
jgi:hypothetical protein